MTHLVIENGSEVVFNVLPMVCGEQLLNYVVKGMARTGPKVAIVVHKTHECQSHSLRCRSLTSPDLSLPKTKDETLSNPPFFPVPTRITIMDPFSIVISLAICIKSRLDNIKEKNSTIVALSANVNRICATLEPFKDVAERESTIKDSLLGLGDALARTKEHLLVWGSKKRSNTLNSFTEFFNSSDIIKMLKDDERQLSLQIMLLSLSFTASSYVRDGLPVISQSEKDTFISVSIRNQDLLEFWREYVDSKVRSFRITCFILFTFVFQGILNS